MHVSGEILSVLMDNFTDTGATRPQLKVAVTERYTQRGIAAPKNNTMNQAIKRMVESDRLVERGQRFTLPKD